MVSEAVIERTEAVAAMRSTRFSDHPPIEGVDGVLHYRLYDQDGDFVAMKCRDTPENRKFVEWTRMFDRYSGKRTDEGETA